MKSAFLIVLLVCALLLTALPATATINSSPVGSHSLVITQLYVAAGNTGSPASTYNVGYIELMNDGPVPVDLTDWTLQYQTSTGSMGPSNTYFIGPNTAYTTGGVNYPAQPTYNYNNPNFHGILQPGQYLLIEFPGTGQQNSPYTATTAPANLPLTADIVLTTTINGKACCGSGKATLPSGSGGKWAVVPSISAVNCGTNATNPAQSNPGTNPYYIPLGPYASDFAGYRSDSGSTPNCYEGTGPIYTKPTTGSKNVVAAMRALVNGCPTDTNNNGWTDGTTFTAIDFPMVAIASTNWSLHNSDSVVAGTGSPASYTPSSCWAGQNSVLPTVKAMVSAPPAVLNSITPPAWAQYPDFTPITEIEAKAGGNPTPIAITVTVTNGGASPTSAVGYQFTADLSQIPSGALVESSLAAAPQKFGYLDLDPDFNNPRYQFPIPPQNPPPTPVPAQGTLTINPPVSDMGKTYTIPITLVDDARRVVNTSVSINIVGSTPGKAGLGAVPASVPATVATGVDLTATITDPGSYPKATGYTVTMDLTAIGGGNDVVCPEVSTDVYTCHTTVTADAALVGSSYAIPVTVVDDQSRTLTLTPANILIGVTAAPEPIATLVWAANSTGNFGNVTQGTASSAQTATLSNTGLAALSIASISGGGDFAASSNCPASLGPNATCAVTVTFTPSAVGARTGSLTVTDDSHNTIGSRQTLALSGNGTPPPPTADLSKTTLAFGNQIVTTASGTQAVTLTNNGGQSLSIAGIALSGTDKSDFSYVTNCGASLAVGSNCAFTVTFKPMTAGTKTATLTVNDNAAGNPHAVQFSGAGVDFPVGPASNGSSTASVTAGQTATYNLQVSPAGPFNGTVQLACASIIQGATCTVNPASVNVNGSAVPFALSIATTASGVKIAQNGMSPIIVGSQEGPGSSGPGMPLGVLCMTILAAATAFATSKKLRQQWRAAAVCTALLCVMGMTACAGLKTSPWPAQPSVSTPAGTYAVTVTATYGSVVRTTTLTLNVK